jgi:RNA recognition motif-containing protein
MGKKLYVGNLTQSVGSTNLRNWFAPYGNVLSARVVADRETERSKGFGFVEMETEDQARAAIDGLNEQEHEGVRLKVDEARPQLARTSITRLNQDDGRRR